MEMLTLHDIYLHYVFKNHRDRINSRLSELKSLSSKKRFIGILKKKRHAIGTLSKYSDISFSEFKSIIKYMNEKTCNEIVLGKTLDMKHKLGFLKIVSFKRKIKQNSEGDFYTGVNRKASEKLKQDIINRGELPLVYEKDENGKIIGSNGGVKWFVYYTDNIIYRWKWLKYKIRPNKKLISSSFKNIYTLRNVLSFCFKPTKDNKELLFKSITEGEHDL